MPPDNTTVPARLTASVLGLADGESASRIAAGMTAALDETTLYLTPIIGSVGVAALFKRSAHVAGASHGWLLDGDGSPASLAALLAQRSDPEAAAGAETYLHAIYDLLVSLVGPALTGQLLPPAWSATPASTISKAPK